MALTLKITVGCPSSTYPSFLAKKKYILIGPLVRNATTWRALGTCTRAFTSEPQQRWTTFQNTFIVCRCPRAWDLWSRHGHAKIVESFSTRRDRHSAELASATTNIYGTRSTIGDRRRYGVSTEQTVAVGGCTTRRQRIARTATMDVIDPPQGFRQRAQPTREPFQSGTDATKCMTALQ